MMDNIVENAIVSRLASSFPRNHDQVNGLHESDAEIIRLGGDSGRCLAMTTDSIVEEIEQRLYADPYQIGWMTVMANLSDLAAVGAKPIGLLLSETLPHDASAEYLTNLHAGIRDACVIEETTILGGDTNRSDRLHMSATAIGLIDAEKPVTRIGSAVGDILYSTGPLGAGNAFAAERVLGSRTENSFMPVAKIKQGIALRPLISACMDTSDGLFATLDQLGRLNKVGFALDEEWETHMDPDAVTTATAIGIHPWMLLAGPHGEYQLVFTARPNQRERVESFGFAEGEGLQRIGRVVETPGITIGKWGRINPNDLAGIRNYDFSGEDGVRGFIRFLFGLESECRKSTQA